MYPQSASEHSLFKCASYLSADEMSTLYLHSQEANVFCCGLARSSRTSGQYVALPTLPIVQGRVFGVRDFTISKNLSQLPVKIGVMFDPTQPSDQLGYIFYTSLRTTNFLKGLAVYPGNFLDDPIRYLGNEDLYPIVRTPSFTVFQKSSSLTLIFCGSIDRDLDENIKL